MNISFIMRPSVTWSWAGALSCSVVVHPCMALYTWVEKVKTDKLRYNARPNERAAVWRPRCIIFQGTRGYSGATGHRVQSLYTCQANLWQKLSRLVSSGKRVSMGVCVCVREASLCDGMRQSCSLTDLPYAATACRVACTARYPSLDTFNSFPYQSRPIPSPCISLCESFRLRDALSYWLNSPCN